MRHTEPKTQTRLTAEDVIAFLESQRNEEQREILMRFFKPGKGEYGEGDEFLGLKVPQTREVVQAVWKDFPLEEVPKLLASRWHEVRLCGLLILVEKFERKPPSNSPSMGRKPLPLGGEGLGKGSEAVDDRDNILLMYIKIIN